MKRNSNDVDVSKLTENQLIKSYKELCYVLGEEIKFGNSKKAQLDNWERFFEWDKIGNQYKITKIYDNPLPVQFIERKSKYYTHIHNMLLILLHWYGTECNENGDTIITKEISKQKLMEFLGMVSMDYFLQRHIAYQYSEDEFGNRIPKDYIMREFYQDTYSFLTKLLQRALKSLHENKNINYKMVAIGVKCDGGNIHLDDDSYNRIIEIEGKILRSLGCQNEYQAIKRGLYERYYILRQDKLKNVFGLSGYYEDIQISIMKSVVGYDIEILKRNGELSGSKNDSSMMLNTQIVEAIARQNERLEERFEDMKEMYKVPIRREVQDRMGMDMDDDEIAKEYRLIRDHYLNKLIKRYPETNCEQ